MKKLKSIVLLILMIVLISLILSIIMIYSDKKKIKENLHEINELSIYTIEYKSNITNKEDIDIITKLIDLNLKKMMINNKKAFPDFFLSTDDMVIGFYEDLEMVQIDLENKLLYFGFPKETIIKIKSYLDF